jgi:hypothetical protein
VPHRTTETLFLRLFSFKLGFGECALNNLNLKWFCSHRKKAYLCARFNKSEIISYMYDAVNSGRVF